VELDMTDLPQTLPASVELAAYRVVQESLTNALRYAQAPTRVRLTCADGALDVLVEDDGPGSPVAVGALVAAVTGPASSGDAHTADGGRVCAGRDGGGRGLAGLAERAQILGGRLEAGPRPAGGYAVHACLPMHQ
jgi:signal transduction histidine kinase